MASDKPMINDGQTKVWTGIDGDTQETTWMNGTLQVVEIEGESYAITVHTYLDINALRRRVTSTSARGGIEGRIARAINIQINDGSLDFEVRVGPNEIEEYDATH